MSTLRQLEYLTLVAEFKHFRRAAERAGVSQPTLSAQLAALEEQLGAQLVERSRSGVIVTPLGQQIDQIARRMLRDARAIDDLAREQGAHFGGTIRFGLPPTIGPYLLPRLVPRLHKAYPSLKLFVREEVPHQIPVSLEQGRLDLVMLPMPVKVRDFEKMMLFREPLLLAVAADHPLAKRTQANRSDLKGESVLTLETGHQLREQVEQICDDFGAHLLTDYEGTSLDTLRQMVGMGMGVTFLPGLYVATSLKGDRSIRTLKLSGRAIYRTIGLCWRGTSERSREFAEVGEHVRATVQRDFPSLQVT